MRRAGCYRTTIRPSICSCVCKKIPRRSWGDDGAVMCCGFAAGTGGNLIHFGADLLAKHIDGNHFPVAFISPIGPAVAAWCAFQMRANLVD